MQRELNVALRRRSLGAFEAEIVSALRPGLGNNPALDESAVLFAAKYNRCAREARAEDRLRCCGARRAPILGVL
jgi:hypothetical protein